MTASRHRRAVLLVRRVPVPVDAAIAVLAREPERVIGSHLGAPWAASGLTAELSVELPSGRQLARQVEVRFGPLLEDDDALALPLWWQATDHPQLFPTFDGGLELRGDGDGTELRLVGSYQPPLGNLGRFADGLVGHHVVTASLDGFLAEAATRLVAAVGPDAPD